MLGDAIASKNNFKVLSLLWGQGTQWVRPPAFCSSYNVSPCMHYVIRCMHYVICSHGHYQQYCTKLRNYESTLRSTSENVLRYLSTSSCTFFWQQCQSLQVYALCHTQPWSLSPKREVKREIALPPSLTL